MAQTTNKKTFLAVLTALAIVLVITAVGYYRFKSNDHSTNVSLPILVPSDQASPDESNNDPLPAISPEMASEIRRMSNHSADGLTEVVHADGSASMDLKNHFQSVTAGVIGPDGKIIMRHGDEFLKNVKTE